MTKQTLLLIVFIPMILAGCKKEKKRICALYDGQVGYSIGTIESLISRPTKATYNYSYAVDGQLYTAKMNAYGIGQDDENQIGRRFIVVYELGNPSNSNLNTNFLIESDSDFEDFKNDHSNTPPPPSFPNKCK